METKTPCQHNIKYGSISAICNIDGHPHARYAKHCNKCGQTTREIDMKKTIEQNTEFLKEIYMLLYKSGENRGDVMCKINEQLEKERENG